ncbi:unnamed protein product [Nezara viridula]|uniref:Ras-GEF domain-containing protein n=1 Tax=Nezara viridula TaxID=85310 RepID=A0A9P0HQH3_NEZVI|nr:unnamed protein product [Nezara viridula]
MKKVMWSLVDRAELSRLEREVSFYDDYCSYRTALRGAASKFNKGDPEHCIVVPLFSLLASDLHTLCQECLTILPNGHINFEKFWQLAKQVTEFITWKQVHCPFPKSPKVITYLQATPVLNEDDQNSLTCLPGPKMLSRFLDLITINSSILFVTSGSFKFIALCGLIRNSCGDSAIVSLTSFKLLWLVCVFL